MGPLCSALKYVEQLGPIKRDAQLSWGELSGAHCNNNW